MPLQLPYVAGFFDGEGCIGFTRTGQCKTVQLRVIVTNTNREILEDLRAQFGGRIKELRHRRAHWKKAFQWEIRNDVAVAFLAGVEPWVRLKADQIICARLWAEARNRSNKRDPETDEPVALCVAQMAWLNKKGADGQVGIDPMTVALPPGWGQECR